MLHLVTPCHQDFLANFIAVDVMHDLLSVKMSELNWQSLESVTLWHMILHCCLEFFIRKSNSTYSLELVINQS